jgi:hypothetical protein
MTQEFAERMNYLSTVERDKAEIGAEILLRLSRGFVKTASALSNPAQ